MLTRICEQLLSTLMTSAHPRLQSRSRQRVCAVGSRLPSRASMFSAKFTGNLRRFDESEVESGAKWSFGGFMTDEMDTWIMTTRLHVYAP